VSGARFLWGWSIGAVLVVALCAGAVVWAWQIHDDDERLAVNRGQALQQAGPLVAEVFSVGAGSYARDRERARALVTDEFAEQYAASFDMKTAPESSVTWTPIETGISDVGPDHADVVVSAEVARSRPGSDPARTIKAVDVRLEKVGGVWKLDRADEVL
jgi:hypothetical protein